MIKEILKKLRPNNDSIKNIASANESLNYSHYGVLSPSVLARNLNSARDGDLVEQMKIFSTIEELDIHVFSELSKRKRAVLSVPWSIVPPAAASESEIRKVAEVSEIINNIIDFEDVLYDLLDATGKGFSALEMLWDTSSAKIWTPKSLEFIPQKNFFHSSGSNKLLYLDDKNTKQELNPLNFVIHKQKAKSGYLPESSLFNVLAWSFAYKSYNLKDLQRFLELFGLPFRLGKYPAGTNKDAQQKLLTAVKSIGYDAAGIVPDSMQIDFITATNQGSSNNFLEVIEYWERKQSIAILGGTLTSYADGKSSTNALGNVHNQVRQEIIESDTLQLASTLTNQLLKPICLLNGLFSSDRLPKFKFELLEQIDQKQQLEALNIAANLGMQIPLDWAHKKLQIPQAGSDDVVLRGFKPSLNPLKAALKKQSVGLELSNNAEIEEFIDEAVNQSAVIESKLIDELEEKLKAAKDYDEAFKIITDSPLSLDENELVEFLKNSSLATATLA